MGAVYIVGMIGEVRAYSDMPVESDFIDDTYIKFCLNRNLREIYDILANSFQTYFRKVEEYEFSASPDSYLNLPLDFYKLINVAVKDTDGRLVELEHMNTWEERIDKTNTVEYNTQLRFMLTGNNLQFNMVPIAGGELELTYVPQYIWKDTSDFVDWQIPAGWESYAVYKTVADCLAKEESDPSYWLQKAAEVKAGIIEYATSRDSPTDLTWTDVYAEKDYEWIN